MNINIDLLSYLSNELKYDAYQIAEYLKIDHKLIRSYAKKYKLTLNESLYNDNNKIYTIPNKESLIKLISVAAHTNYLCEGWHTEKTDRLSFYNQDEKLVKIFSKCIYEIYNYNRIVSINIMYNKDCENSQVKTEYYKNCFTDDSKYRITYSNDPTRLNPIILARCGNKNMARLFINNAYKILDTL